MSITISSEPVDALRCKFIFDRDIADRGVRKFTRADDAEDVPVVVAVLGVPAVCEVVASGNMLTVIQDGSRSWEDVEAQVRYAAATALGGEDAVQDITSAEDDDEAFEIVARLFESQINPAVAQHGGKIELIDVQNMTIIVRMMGGCQGCGMANVTLRQGIEATVKRQLPGIKGIKDITDHASGTNPYFQASKK